MESREKLRKSNGPRNRERKEEGIDTQLQSKGIVNLLLGSLVE